jgi:hypothetical protein
MTPDYCIAGAISYGGTIDKPTAYVADGTAHWHDRVLLDGSVLRWRRAATCKAEALDLAASLVGVPDDSPGWLLLEKTP